MSESRRRISCIGLVWLSGGVFEDHFILYLYFGYLFLFQLYYYKLGSTQCYMIYVYVIELAVLVVETRLVY